MARNMLNLLVVVYTKIYEIFLIKKINLGILLKYCFLISIYLEIIFHSYFLIKSLLIKKTYATS